MSPSVPTVYQVFVESLGCTGTASMSIGINSPINLTISQTSPTTCIIANSPKLSKPVTLTASGAGSYTWAPYDPVTITFSNTPTIVVRPHATTCYTVTGFLPFCSGTAVACVSVEPQFSLQVSPSNATICLGQTLTLIAGNVGPEAVGPISGFTYSWTGSTPNIFDWSLNDSIAKVYPTISTQYTADVADTRSCVSLPSVSQVEVDLCTNISSKNNTNNEIKVFPNPVEQEVTLQGFDLGNCDLTLLDVLGKSYF